MNNFLWEKIVRFTPNHQENGGGIKCKHSSETQFQGGGAVAHTFPQSQGVFQTSQFKEEDIVLGH